MQKIVFQIMRFMSGRNGLDQFNLFLFVFSLVLTFVDIFFFEKPYLYLFILVIQIYTLFRLFSKKLFQRRTENQKYLQLSYPFRQFKSLLKKQRQDSSRKYFCCPRCFQIVRIPLHRGKVTITCPKCQHRFNKKI